MRCVYLEREIYFKDLAHTQLGRLVSLKSTGCAGSLETHGRAEVDV